MKPFSFLNPLFNYIDGGKLFRQPFQILYYIIGIANALLMVFAMSGVIDMYRYYSGAIYVLFFFMGLVSLALAAFSVLYWFRRAAELKEHLKDGERFQAIPAVANLIIAGGEWFGITAAVFTFCLGIIGAIVIPLAVDYGAGASFLGAISIAIVGPIVSYILLILSRLFGEQILAIGVIANNTTRIARNTEN